MIEKNIYVSSDGTEKDVKTLDYQYLVNAVAKAYRSVVETTNLDEYRKHAKNIEVLEDELFRRRNDLFVELLVNKEN